jgi:trimeric autotransporter adhesin
MKTKLVMTLLILFALLLTGPSLGAAQEEGASAALGTAITYQGRLADGGTGVNGAYDFRFTLYSAAAGGSQVGSLVFIDDFLVGNGYFTVQLDFGAGAFGNAARWLEVAVRPGASLDTYTVLSPRQALTPAPFALFASSSPWSGLTGIPAGFADGVDNDTTYTAGIGLVLSSGQFSLNSAYRLPQSCTNNQVPKWNGSAWICAADNNTTSFWKLTGNAGTNPSTNYLGTSDNTAFELRVNATRVLRLENITGTDGNAPNLIGGYNANWITSGVYGATLFGGGYDTYGGSLPNRVTDVYGTVSGGFNNQSGDNAGLVTDTAFATVGGGMGNTASGPNATIGGGEGNTASGENTTVCGGMGNDATDDRATIGGGSGNTAGSIATVGGGVANTAASGATVGGGYWNTASGDDSTIAGGSGNTASGRGATISGGGQYIDYEQTASGDYSLIGGGRSNIASGDFSTVGGGANNTASGFGSVVAGGGGYITGCSPYCRTSPNQASGNESAIVGGLDNVASGEITFIGGGMANSTSELGGVVVGGMSNPNSGEYGFLGGGLLNEITDQGFRGVLVGGQSNVLDGGYGFIGSGSSNTVNGYLGMVLGGDSNTAGGYGSFASGHRAKTNSAAAGSFVWSDSNDFDLWSWNPNEFVARATGGFWFISGIDGSGNITSGAHLVSGANQWSQLSDRNSKTAFQNVDAKNIAAAVAGLPIQSWQYKSQDASIRHIGPMAQDFSAAFGLGEDEHYIGTLDADGVALAAIQGLYQLNQEQAAEIQSLKARLSGLESSSFPHTAGSAPLIWIFLGLLGISQVGMFLALLRRKAGRS